MHSIHHTVSGRGGAAGCRMQGGVCVSELLVQIICKRQQQCCSQARHTMALHLVSETSFHKSGFRTQQPEHLLSHAECHLNSAVNQTVSIAITCFPAYEWSPRCESRNQSPQYAAALDRQKYPAPKRLLHHMYACFSAHPSITWL